MNDNEAAPQDNLPDIQHNIMSQTVDWQFWGKRNMTNGLYSIYRLHGTRP